MNSLVTRLDTTIAQLITPRVRGAVHIVRLSGAKSLAFLLAHTRLKAPIKPRYFYYTNFYHTTPEHARTIDNILCVYFKAPHSYTGEDVVELHLHGSLGIVDDVLACAVAQNIALAQAGEFTYRAFFNGKLTLEQAEALATLINSQVSSTRTNALNILEQKTSLRFQTIHNELLSMLAQLESTIEFPEEDIPHTTATKATLYDHYHKALTRIKGYFEQILKSYRLGERLETGINVALIGPPNVGKSTFLNCLLKKDRALVSNVAGTTRDYIEATLEIAGVRFKLVDTAGLHNASDAIEQAGMQQTVTIAQATDIVIILLACDQGTAAVNQRRLNEQLTTLTKLTAPNTRHRKASQSPKAPVTWLYINKSDMPTPAVGAALATYFQAAKTIEANECTFQEIISLQEHPQDARAKVYAAFKQFLAAANITALDNETNIALLNLRQAKIAETIIKHLAHMVELLVAGESEEVLAEEFRLLNDSFAELNLNIDHDKIYDALFSQFCIGK